MKTKSRVYLIPNKVQLELKEICMKNFILNNDFSDDWDFFFDSEKLFSFNGVLHFVMKKKAKKGTGMLFMCDKTYGVSISKTGIVKSKLYLSEKEEKYKINKYQFFI